MTQHIYSFHTGHADGQADMADVLGSKGANLAEMCRLNLPVPAGFTISTQACQDFLRNGVLAEQLKTDIKAAIANIETELGLGFGDADRPLLVSIRSGAAISMPGMMDSILNLGLTDETVEGLSAKTNNPRFAWDSYRRFIQMYGDVVLGVANDEFEFLIDDVKQALGVLDDTELSDEDWKNLCGQFKTLIETETGKTFPQQVEEQLWGAIGAVFASWENQRARTFRRLHNISDALGTAVNIQAMVFGNLGENSATGVAFTRNPSTGEQEVYGEYLPNAQGEDVVAGLRTPHCLTLAAREKIGAAHVSLEEAMPDIFEQIKTLFSQLEQHFKSVQEVEFTIQENRLWVLQTRSGKCNVKAALKIAADMVAENIMSKAEALQSIPARDLEQLLHPVLSSAEDYEILTKGLPASPGAVSGRLAFSSAAVEAQAARDDSVILIRMETSPEDIHGIYMADGILTARGGMTSHAAVVARGLGRPCVSGAGDLRIDYDRQQARIGDLILKSGDIVTIDGNSGQVIKGAVSTVEPELPAAFQDIMHWAEEACQMQVRVNAETEIELALAQRFGGEGVGLYRTEHLFFAPDSIAAIRRLILSDEKEDKTAAIETLCGLHADELALMFGKLQGQPIDIRLLDASLHEFMPQRIDDIEALAVDMQIELSELKLRIARLASVNPGFAHRGVRVGIIHQNIYEAQIRAIAQAMQKAGIKQGVTVMLPLIMSVEELTYACRFLQTAIEDYAPDMEIKLGAMIETPRACLLADEIAAHVDLLSFGSNDLTQTSFGLSHDDISGFLRGYQKRGILLRDPFVQLDVKGVGALIDMACMRARAVKPDIEIALCGGHGGDPSSITFCAQMGMSYISCMPYKIPVARLVAAQSRLG